MHTLFVYGTLQHPPLLARLIGRVPRSAPAQLVGHRAAALEGRVYPGLVVDPDVTASGRLIEVDDDELAVLDSFEGPQYERVDVVARGDVGEIPAQAWLLTGDSARLALAGSWSFERFLLADAGSFLEASVAGRAHPGSATAP